MKGAKGMTTLQRRKYVGDVTECVFYGGCNKATKYVSPSETIKATLRGKRDRSKHIEILLSLGPPNYLEREFIKKAKKVGEPFPVKKIQLK